MINKTKLTESQLATVRGLITQFGGLSVLTRKQLHEGYLALKGEGSSTPYFISKNTAAKSPTEPHRYDLALLLPENQTSAGIPVAKRVKDFHAKEPKRPDTGATPETPKRRSTDKVATAPVPEQPAAPVATKKRGRPSTKK